MTYRPWYNENVDYQTNAKSYMDYLGRVNKFMKVLMEDYEVFQELILEEFKQFSLDNNQTIEEFQERLDGIKQEMTDLFVEWLEDGTLEQIINHDVLGNKADKSFVDSEIERLDQIDENITTQVDSEIERLDQIDENFTTKLTQTNDKVENVNNAAFPLNIPTYDNFGQTTHPDVLYFENELWGYKYWMVHTPYPFGNDLYENPSIVVSNDGVDWIDHPDIENPIASVTQEENDNGEHLSDGILVYRSDINRLEFWWRFRNKQTGEENYRRRMTTDGKNLTEEEIVYHAGVGSLSPSVKYENGKYRMWTVTSTGGYRVQYRESTSLPAWTSPIDIPLTYADGEEAVTPWHVHIYKEHNNLYHLILNDYIDGFVGQKLLWGTSTDGMRFENLKTILTSPKIDSAWDGGTLYRSSLIKVDDNYKLYYSARGARNWYVGLVEGKQIDNLKSGGNSDRRGYTITNKLKTKEVYTPELETNYIYISNDINGKQPEIRFLDRGNSGASITTGDSNNRLQIRNDTNTGYGDLSLSELKVARITGFHDGLSHDSPIYIDSPEGDKPKLVLREVGKYASVLTLNDYGAVMVTTEAGTPRNLETATLILSGINSRNVEGEIRYNKDVKKHQGYDGTTWHNLY